MKTHKNLYQKLCSKENIVLAFKKAQKRKSRKPYVIEFKDNLNKNLRILRDELLSEEYKPRPLRTFIIRERSKGKKNKKIIFC